MEFNATVKSDPAGILKGGFKATLGPDGLRMERKKQPPVLVGRGTAATYQSGNMLTVALPGRAVTIAVTKFPAYQARLARGVAEYLRGERATFEDADVKMEWYLLVPAILPFGIMILTRGGAIWGALGGAVAVGCLYVAQVESMPKLARLVLIAVINAALYAAIYALVATAA